MSTNNEVRVVRTVVSFSAFGVEYDMERDDRPSQQRIKRSVLAKAKLACKDYRVSVSGSFELDGVLYIQALIEPKSRELSAYAWNRASLGKRHFERKLLPSEDVLERSY